MPREIDSVETCQFCGTPAELGVFQCSCTGANEQASAKIAKVWRPPSSDAAEGAGETRRWNDVTKKYEWSAPPKPAPDAMREALKAARRFVQFMTSGSIQERSAVVRQIDAALSAPVPPPDGAAEASNEVQSSDGGLLGMLADEREGWRSDLHKRAQDRDLERRTIDLKPSPRPPDDLRSALADDIRAQGWVVAVHNDYRQAGQPHTFWLFTKDGQAIKGEGSTDAAALNQARAALRSPEPDATVSEPIADERVKQLAAQLIGYVKARPDYSYALLLAHVSETLATFAYNEILNHRKVASPQHVGREATVSEPAAWQALPYARPQELVAAFKGGGKFVLHYYGKTFDVTHMEARERVVYIQPPGLPVKVLPDGSSAEGDNGGIWLEATVSARDAVIEAAKILETRAAGYAARGNVIFNGEIMAEELRSNASRIRSLIQGAKP